MHSNASMPLLFYDADREKKSMYKHSSRRKRACINKKAPVLRNQELFIAALDLTRKERKEKGIAMTGMILEAGEI